MRHKHTLALPLFGSLLLAAPAADAAQEWIVSLAEGPETRAQVARLAQYRAGANHAAFESLAAEMRASGTLRGQSRIAEIEQTGARVLAVSPLGNLLLVEGQALDELLAGTPFVRSVQRNIYLEPQAVNTDQAIGAGGHDHQGAWALGSPVPFRGHGIEVAVIDTGVDMFSGAGSSPHPAFHPDGVVSGAGPGIGGSRVLSAQVVPNPFQGTSTPSDAHGHGTRVASILLGADWGAAGASDGGAPGALLRSYRVTTDQNPGAAALYVAASAIQEAALVPQVRVLNFSFEGITNLFHSDLGWNINLEIDRAVDSGVFVSLASGINTPGSTAPHGAFNAMVVGASPLGTPQPYLLADWSGTAIGPLPDGRRYPHILAVGEGLSAAQVGNPASVAYTWGTSGPAALVSAAAAVLFEALPGLTPAEARALLLASSSEVQVGEPAARGFGYLRVPEAVEAALAGRYGSVLLPQGATARYSVDARAGVPLNLALAWNRPSSAVMSTNAGDLDLRLRSPEGALLASSTALFDNNEVLRYVPAVDGRVFVEVESLWAEPTTFALAGVLGTPQIVNQSCPGTEASLSAIVPAQLFPQSGVPNAPIKLLGCNLEGTSAVRIGGQQAALIATEAKLVAVLPPTHLPAGALDMEVDTPSGTLVMQLAVGATTPFLQLAANFGQFAHSPGELTGNLRSEPGAPYWLVASTLSGPTSIPGLVDLAIGAGGLELLLVGSGVLPGSGFTGFSISTPPVLPAGLTVHMQAAVLLPEQGGLVPSNSAKSLYLSL